MFEISVCRRAGPRAVIVTQPEMSVPELVMNCFAPSITHSPSSSARGVRVLPASDPASGSVSPKAASLRPAQSSGSHSSFCSSVPQRWIGIVPSEVWAAIVIADRGVDPGQLLDRERVGERVGAAAAVLLRERDPHQPELAHLGDDLVGEALVAVELLGDRRDLLRARSRARCRAAAAARRSARSPSRLRRR